VRAATETIENMPSKIFSIGKSWEDMDTDFKLQTHVIVLPIACQLQCSNWQRESF